MSSRWYPLIAAAMLALAPAAVAQVQVGSDPNTPDEPAPSIELAPVARDLLDAPYLTDQERSEARVFHGQWQPADLEDPGARARAALIAGAVHDPSLTNPDVAAIDRAEGALLRGEPENAIELLAQDQTTRARRLRAEALLSMGRLDDAANEAERATMALGSQDSGEVSEAARAARVLLRLRGGERAANGFRGLINALAQARERNRLDWRPRLVEAVLLEERDNGPEARAALMEALRLNPRCAEAWSMLAEMQVDTFGFSTANAIAGRLDEIARTVHAEAKPHLLGVLASARGRLRSADPEGAIMLLDPLLERLPTHRHALALRAAADARDFDMNAARARADEFSRLAPGLSDAWYEMGRTLSDARQYAEASEALARATELEPNRPEPWVELGLLEMQWGRDVPAIDALSRAVAVDPFHIRADNSLRLAEELLTYDTVESEHFTIRYRPGVDRVLAREMPRWLDDMHARVTGDAPASIRFVPGEKTLVELMPDHARFAVRITGSPSIWTVAAAMGRVVAMEAPKTGPTSSVGAYDWLRVMRHEYVHTVTLARTKNRIPHWFTEAAAVHLEDGPRDERRSRLLASKLASGELFTLDRINLGFIRPETQDERPLAYAQSQWMYEFMLGRFGEESPLVLMDLYAEGLTEAEAIPRATGVSAESFYSEFLAWAETQVITWGLALPEGVPSVEEMLVQDQTDARTRDRGELLDGAKQLLDGVLPPPKGLDEPKPSVTTEWIIEKLETYPDHPQLLEILVQAALDENGGEADAAMIPLLERYAAAVPVAERPHRMLAKLYLDGKGALVDTPRSAAIPHLEFLDAREIYSAAYAIELARLYADGSDWDRSWEKAEKAVRISPFDADYREFAARVALVKQDLDGAHRHLLALRDLEPGEPHHEKRLGALEAMRDRAGD
ncbi:MAG: tetratricopeptide repeat protein [Planctomycetota bacterium]